MRARTLLVLGVNIWFLGGCGGGASVTPEALREHTLSQKELDRFIAVYPRVAPRLRGLLAEEDPRTLSTDPYSVFAGLKLDRDLQKALRANGYTNPGDFLLALGVVLPAYYKASAQARMDSLRAQLVQTEEAVAAGDSTLAGRVDSLRAQLEVAERVWGNLKYQVKPENLQLVQSRLDTLRRILQ